MNTRFLSTLITSLSAALVMCLAFGQRAQAAGGFLTNSPLHTERYFQTETVLPNGKVLVAGGDNNNSGPLSSAELYDPVTGTWTVTGSMNTVREHHTATLLPNGKVLVAGGNDLTFNPVASAELYDPVTGIWTGTGPMTTPRYFHTATVLLSGKVLVAGGGVDNGSATNNTAPHTPHPRATSTPPRCSSAARSLWRAEISTAVRRPIAPSYTTPPAGHGRAQAP